MVFDRGAFLFAWSAPECLHTDHVIQRLLCLCLLACLLPHCASKDPSTTPIKGTENSADGPGYLVGIIEFVNPDQRFVLVKTQGAATIPSGAKLTALDATGALSEIVVSPERKGSHLTADIVSGNPRAGNLVVYQPNKGAAPITTAPASAPASSGPDVEWREGQPPPLETDSLPALPPLESPIPPQPTNPIPLDPLSPSLE